MARLLHGGARAVYQHAEGPGDGGTAGAKRRAGAGGGIRGPLRSDDERLGVIATMTRIVAVIPARMGSSRFPGKPLANLVGRPMIEHVYRNTVACRALDDVFVATCDSEIARAVEAFGGRVVMTSPKHERASDRVAEAVQHDKAGIVVMVQGDEPMIHPRMIDEAIAPLLAEPE